MVKQRSAKAVIRNHTGEDIVGATLVHKYSDNYVDQNTWARIADGTNCRSMPVRYNTGFGTTGRDWWLVTWFNADRTQFYYSSPNNFRAIFDTAEGFIVDLLADTREQGQNSSDDDEQLAGIVAAAMQPLFNRGATAGFKQHILRGEDENNFVNIDLTAGGCIVIGSPSGRSETVYTSRQV